MEATEQGVYGLLLLIVVLYGVSLYLGKKEKENEDNYVYFKIVPEPGLLPQKIVYYRECNLDLYDKLSVLAKKKDTGIIEITREEYENRHKRVYK